MALDIGLLWQRGTQLHTSIAKTILYLAFQFYNYLGFVLIKLDENVSTSSL